MGAYGAEAAHCIASLMDKRMRYGVFAGNAINQVRLHDGGGQRCSGPGRRGKDLRLLPQ